MGRSNANQESTSLLGRDSGKKESDYHVHGNRKVWSRVMDMAVGFGICAVFILAVSFTRYHYAHVDTTTPKEGGGKVTSSLRSEASRTILLSSAPSAAEEVDTDSEEELKSLKSKYLTFQAMGFQIYTGGAPVLLEHENSNGETTDLVPNPECSGLESFGHMDDFDTDNNTLPTSFWQCYLGHSDPYMDVQHRLNIMRDAVERAYEVATQDESTLKIFIAPEFFWRGREGAYVFDHDDNSSSAHKSKRKQDKMVDHGNCTEVCKIMMGLEEIVAQKKYKDWLFLFGTVVVSENLPKEDTYDYLFYNFAPIYKGFDPDLEDHHGKRFLLPKRYVSNVDFLTPVRQFNGTITKEIVDLTQQEMQKAHAQDYSDEMLQIFAEDEQEDDAPVVVQNPFDLKHTFYDRKMWYEYKEEIEGLGYHMIEYDWIIVDNITMTVEVCLDHDAHTALSAYLADNVLGSPTRIPKTVSKWDPVTKKYKGGIEKVRIPRHQAQLSLVSSMGMTANPQSMALTQNGTLILQDGQSDQFGSMEFTALDCDTKSWHFDGGTEFISRTAAMTDTRIDFGYQIHAPAAQFSIYSDDESPESDDTNNNNDMAAWKTAIDGVFTKTKFEPMVTLYPIRHIAKV